MQQHTYGESQDSPLSTHPIPAFLFIYPVTVIIICPITVIIIIPRWTHQKCSQIHLCLRWTTRIIVGWASFQVLQLKCVTANVQQEALLIQLHYCSQPLLAWKMIHFDFRHTLSSGREHRCWSDNQTCIGLMNCICLWLDMNRMKWICKSVVECVLRHCDTASAVWVVPLLLLNALNSVLIVIVGSV
jgi:hypothetical protein